MILARIVLTIHPHLRTGFLDIDLKVRRIGGHQPPALNMTGMLKEPAGRSDVWERFEGKVH